MKIKNQKEETQMKKISLTLLFISLIGFSSAHSDGEYYGMMDGMYRMMSGNYGYGLGIFSWLTGLLVIVALVLLIVWLIKQIQKK